MCEKYDIDDKTRFLVLFLDAKMNAQDIAHIIHRHLKTVYRWASLTKKGHDIRIPKKKGGHNKLMTEEIENKITKMIKENPEGSTLTKLASRIGGISASTIRRALAKMGIKFRPFDRGIIYTEEERLLRVEFCKKMLSDEGRLIYRTFFSDEMGIELNKTHKTKGWQLPNEKIKKKGASEYIKLDCWGAISAQGATSLDIYKKGMKGELYREVIERHRREMEKLYPDGEEFYFLQDSHPTHRMNEEWIVKEQKLALIRLPKRSPDLNIIENLWMALKERVASDVPANEKELRASLVSNWEALTKIERLQSIFDGLHRRYILCVEKEGQKL